MADPKLRLNRHWLNPKPSDPQTFEEQVTHVSDVYKQAQELEVKDGTHTMSVDKNPRMRAL